MVSSYDIETDQQRKRLMMVIINIQRLKTIMLSQGLRMRIIYNMIGLIMQILHSYAHRNIGTVTKAIIRSISIIQETATISNILMEQIIKN
jgi:hypothetical protein